MADGTHIFADAALEGLVACPECDALYRAADVPTGARAVCARCHTVLIAPRDRAGMAIISLALAAIVLVAGALWFPFLRIDARGLWQEATLWDVATSFPDGPLLFVSVAVTAAILVLPLLRAALLLYTLVPVVFDRPPRPQARRAFALSERLRPWSMAEIFVIGTSVALVKVAGLATVSLGPAFWAFCALIVVNAASHAFMSATTVWDAIEDGGRRTDGREMVERTGGPDRPAKRDAA